MSISCRPWTVVDIIFLGMQTVSLRPMITGNGTYLQYISDVYVMPRFAVLPGHEYKACKHFLFIHRAGLFLLYTVIPYTKVFLQDPPKPEHAFVRAQVTSIRPNHITLSRSFPELGIPTPDIAFDYAIYALGSHLPPPLNLWGSSTEKEAEAMSPYGGLKSEGCVWFKEKQKTIEAAPTILVVGGGALGIREFT